MSRCYRIEVTESLRRHVDVDDGVCLQLELLGILPPERMSALLGEQLQKRGYSLDANGDHRKTVEGGVNITVTAAGEVQIGLSDEADLELEGTRSANTYEEIGEETSKKLTEALQKELEEDADRATEALRKQLTQKLESVLETVRTELDDAVNRATGEALKEKAKQLGEVQEIREDPETGEVVIRVRV